MSAKLTKIKPSTRFEIYTKHPITKEYGWNIRWVEVPENRAKATETIKSFPDFDCIISINDYSINVDEIFKFDGETVEFKSTKN